VRILVLSASVGAGDVHAAEAIELALQRIERDLHALFPTALLDRERRKGRCQARIVTVVTDFELHGFWLSAPSDDYFVANPEACAHLEALRIAPQAITVSGIPTHRGKNVELKRSIEPIASQTTKSDGLCHGPAVKAMGYTTEKEPAQLECY
jgi:hypothetical protein